MKGKDMIDKFLIVNKDILPEVIDKVIEARNYLNEGKVKNVSEAVKKAGISRSTYYKYKDSVFLPSDYSIGRKAVIGMMLYHKSGVLSDVINLLSSVKANILTITQSIPVNGKASVNISLDFTEINITIDNLVKQLKGINGVNGAKLLSIE